MNNIKFISEKALTEIQEDPKFSSYSTEYFVCIDGKDKEAIGELIRIHQHHLPTLLAELKGKGYELDARVLKNGRILIVPYKKNNNEVGGMLGGLFTSAFMLLTLFVCFVVKLVGLFL